MTTKDNPLLKFCEVHGLRGVDLDDAIYEIHDNMAAEINHNGIVAQLEALCRLQGGEEAAMDTLKDLVSKLEEDKEPTF